MSYPKCVDCGGGNKRAKSGLCGKCYAQSWRSQISDGKRKQISKKAYEYNKARSEWRAEVAEKYRLKKGIKWPEEFKVLFQANKRLEKALAKTKKRP